MVALVGTTKAAGSRLPVETQLFALRTTWETRPDPSITADEDSRGAWACVPTPYPGAPTG